MRNLLSMRSVMLRGNISADSTDPSPSLNGRGRGQGGQGWVRADSLAVVFQEHPKEK